MAVQKDDGLLCGRATGSTFASGSPGISRPERLSKTKVGQKVMAPRPPAIRPAVPAKQAAG